MAQNTDATDATLTEYLSAADNTDDSIDGPAEISYIVDGRGLWVADDGDSLDEDPDEYKAVCSCGEEFGSWGSATAHVDEQH